MIFYDYYSNVPDEELEQFVTEQQLGRLITVSGIGQPHIGLYPFLFLGSTIEMHLNRQDELLADLKTNSKCAFEIDEVLATIGAKFARHHYEASLWLSACGCPWH